MYDRLLKIPPHSKKSFFLFGPRGTGKTTWIQKEFPNALYFDLLESETFIELQANPQRLEKLIPPGHDGWIIIDEVQKIPQLLSEVHRLIEKKSYKFILTGSSARKIRKNGGNLLAGRALTYHMHPLTVEELGEDFDPSQSINYGFLPSIPSEDDPKKYLESYVLTYLKEEVQQEGLTRNIGTFTRFLEVASFSQGSLLNMSEVARESHIHRKTVEEYFSILEDLLIAYRLPAFIKKAKRRVITHPKFYYFDVGVFRTIRPMGPLDRIEEVEGPALETLILQQLLAYNDYFNLGYTVHFWRTSHGVEVDFVLYGPKGIIAFEIKRSRSLSFKDYRPLEAFCQDYPGAKGYVLFGGQREEYHNGIEAIPLEKALLQLPELMGKK